MYEQDEHKLRIIREEDRTVFIFPIKDWPSALIPSAEQAQSGDKIVVDSLAQEEAIRYLLVNNYKKTDVVIERLSGMVRFDVDTGNTGKLDSRALAQQIMEHLTGIRARHRGQAGPDTENIENDTRKNNGDTDDNHPDQPEQGRTD